jgi:hypothetical protein
VYVLYDGMIPFRFDDDNVPCFTNHQIDDYGFPENWGYEVYRIIENRDTNYMTTDYKMESSYYKRPVHRYSRRQRFVNVLHQLLGDKGKVPEWVVSIVKTYLKPGDIWNHTRSILKHYKLRIYYNRIPYIVHQITKTNSSKPVHVNQYENVMADFDRFCYLYDQHKNIFKRTYFPNMRFMALKLIEKHGIELNYPIPFTRTNRKRKDLEFIWQWFLNQ